MICEINLLLSTSATYGLDSDVFLQFLCQEVEQETRKVERKWKILYEIKIWWSSKWSAIVFASFSAAPL